jgi:hypothetical protein
LFFIAIDAVWGRGLGMRAPDEYRDLAEACVCLADKTAARHRALFLRLARTWREIADEAMKTRRVHGDFPQSKSMD